MPIRSHSVRALSSAVSRMEALTHLNLSGTLTAPSDEGDERLGTAMGFRPTQGRKAVSPIDATALAAALGQLRDLVALDLSGNELAGGGGAAVCEALAGAPRLSALNLSAAGLGDGVERFWPQLAKLTALAQLDLGANKLGSRGVSAFGAHIGSLVCLEALDLSENFFFELGDLGPRLKTLPLLRALNLNTNFLRAVNLLTPHLQEMRALRLLSVVGNPMTANHRAALSRRMARCQVHVVM